MAACGWVCALFRLAASSACPRPERSTLQLLIVAFPVEIALAGASGRAYHHYYTAWLPVFALLASFLFLVLASWWRVSCSSLGMADERMRWVGGIALCCVLMAAGVYPLRVVAQQILGAHSEAWARQQREAVAFVSRATGGDDYLLVWGAEPSINFLSKRRCPSRFSFQYPLFTRGYQNGKMVAELISDIAGRSPAFLIDTSSSNTLVPPLDPEMREKWRSPNPVYGLIPEMDGLFEFIGMRYQRICTVGPLRWSVYARRA